MIKPKAENYIVNTLENNSFINENENYLRHITNKKINQIQDTIKPQPGEIYYSENFVYSNDFNQPSNVHNNVFLTSSKEISNRDDNTLNRKILSIINSSGTEGDENSGLHIVIQNPNYLLESENKIQFKRSNPNNAEEPKKLKFDFLEKSNHLINLR